MSGAWTGGFGIVKHADRPVPSPGVTAALHVRLETYWPDGEIHVREWDHEWPGYTAAEAVAARYKRLKEARSDVTRDGLTLTVRRDRTEYVEVEVLTFADP